MRLPGKVSLDGVYKNTLQASTMPQYPSILLKTFKTIRKENDKTKKIKVILIFLLMLLLLSLPIHHWRIIIIIMVGDL